MVRSTYPQNWTTTGNMPSEDTQFKKGKDWKGNAGGRPKGGLKDYDRQKFLDMTPKQKEAFLKTISPELRYKMAEGNPQQELAHSGEIKVSKKDKSKALEAVKSYLPHGKDISDIKQGNEE